VAVGTTYRLRLEVVGSTLKGYVNDELKIQGSDTTFASGRAGLLAFFSDIAFDDVHIDPTPSSPVLAADDFEDGDAADWTTSAGTWTVTSDGTSQVLRQTDTWSVAQAQISSATGSRQIIELNAKALSFDSVDAWIGVTARYVDTSNYYCVSLNNGGTIALRKVEGGAVTTLATATTPVATGSWQALRVTAVGESLKVYLNGLLMLQATDAAFPSGSVGLATSSASAEFDEILVVAP
jgi:pectate lyase